MSRIYDRQKAIGLRKKGFPYSKIKHTLGIPKSTLSGWLKDYPLTDKQMAALTKNRTESRYVAIEKTRITKQNKKKARLLVVYKQEQARWGSLTKTEIELAGLFLYWGEGGKTMSGSLSLSNTDPQVLKFTLYWLKYALNVPQEKIKVFLHLYNDMNVGQEIEYWSRELKLPATQFSKPYIKTSSRVEISHKGFGHGTCGLSVNNTRLKEKIMMSIKAIADYYAQKI